MAKSSEASLIIKLKDEATAGLNKISSSLGSLKTAFFAVTATVASFIAVGYQAIKAYAEEEASINKLNVALKNQGLEVESVSKDYIDFAPSSNAVTFWSSRAKSM